jgi:hypothetical protein
MKSAQTEVLDIAYEESGPADGRPVILLHGFPDDIHAYDDVAGLLAVEGWRVIVPYLRGYGPPRFRDRATPRSGNRGLWLKGQMLEPWGIRGGRLERPRRCPSLARSSCCSPTTIRVAGWFTPGHAGTSIDHAELQRVWRRLQPLATPDTPLDVAPPRTSRFGGALVLSRVHWVRPELVAEVKYLTWTEDNLLRQVVYEGLREDKPAAEVRRSVPHPKHIASTRSTVSSKRPRSG